MHCLVINFVELPLESVWFVNLDRKGYALNADISILNIVPDSILLPLQARFHQISEGSAKQPLPPFKSLEERAIYHFISPLLRNVPQYVKLVCALLIFVSSVNFQGKFVTPEFVAGESVENQPLLKELAGSQLFNMFKNQFCQDSVTDSKVMEFLKFVAQDDTRTTVESPRHNAPLDFAVKEGTFPWSIL